MSNLERAIEIVEEDIRSPFEDAWEDVTGESPPEYRIMVWGSTVRDNIDNPNDLDVIIEYTGDSIEPEKEESIEGMLKSRVPLTGYDFGYLDPLVTHYLETEGIISQSRLSEIYSVDESGWVSF